MYLKAAKHTICRQQEINLQRSLLNPPPHLVKFNLLPTPQALLQRTPDLDRLHRTRQSKRQCRIIQTSRGKLVRLDHKRLPETPIIMFRNLPPHASILAHLDKRTHGISIYGDFPLRAHKLSHIVLPSSHDATTVKIRDASTPKLDDANTIVHVPVFAQVRLHGRDAHGVHGLDEAVLAEKPQREVYIVDIAVDEDAAAELGVVDEEAAGVQLVAGLGAEDGEAADGGCGGARVGVAVRGVEAAGEAAHYF